jgi:serine/threonine-protein kinase
MFFLLTGRPPLDHKSKAVAAVQAIEEPAPDILTLRKDCPPALTSVVARCLAKDPADRFQTAKELAASLSIAGA